MAEITRELKRKLGTVLIKLKKQDFGLNQEEWQLAKVLEGKGLVKFLGPDQGPKIMSITEYSKQLQLAALSQYVLTGIGEELTLRHTEEHLQSGRYLMPGESAWFDRWPWKLIWPAIVSIITTLIVYAVKGSGTK